MEHQIHLNPKGILTFPAFMDNQPFTEGLHTIVYNPDHPVTLGDTLRINSGKTVHTVNTITSCAPDKWDWSAYGFTPLRITLTTSF